MEKIGERSLTCLLAFTALRLEMGWRSSIANSKNLLNLNKHLQPINTIEQTVAELKLIH